MKSGQIPGTKSALGIVPRILILIFSILLIDICFDVYDGFEQRAAQEAELATTARNITHSTALDMKRSIEAARQVLITLSQNQAVRERDVERCNTLLGGVVRDLPMYDYISSN